MVNLSIITHEVEFQGVKFKGKNLAPKNKKIHLLTKLFLKTVWAKIEAMCVWCVE